MPAATAASAFKNAFVTAARSLWAGTGVQVAFGHPGQSQADDIVAFGRVSSDQEFATYGSNRGREETLTLTVVFSMFRGGGPDMEQVASDRGYELLGQLEEFARVTDTTIGGTVRHCFLESHESDGSTDPQILSAGRLIEITAQFGAKARVTS